MEKFKPVMDLTPFKGLIKERCGLCFDDQREATLSEGIGRRMSEKGVDSPSVYLERLIGDSEEFHRLVNLITINETYFFREPVHLNILVQRLVPALLSVKGPGCAIKILSAGCSTGEEPYSIAMALLERFGPASRSMFSVIGFDIDSSALERAEKGVFGEYSFRTLERHLKDRYFERMADGSHKIKDFVMDMVGFNKINMLGDSYPDSMHRADVIFYRNVSIYFDPPTQKEIFRRLAGLLNDSGHLILSSTETYSHNINVLSICEIDGIFLFKKARPAEHAHGSKTPLTAAPPMTGTVAELNLREKPKAPVRHNREYTARHIAPAAPIAGVSADSLYEEALSLAKDNKYAAALTKVDEAIGNDPIKSQKVLTLKACILVNLQRTEEAGKLSSFLLSMNEWNIEGHLISGIVSRMKSETEAALKSFKAAVYIQPSSWLAHFHLGETYVLLNETDSALRQFEVALNILKKGSPASEGAVYPLISFSPEQTMRMCEHRLSAMGRMPEGQQPGRLGKTASGI